MSDVETLTRVLTQSGNPITGAKTATFNTDSFVNDWGSGGVFTVVASAASGSSPTLSLKPQFSSDGGTTWHDIDATNGISPNLTAAGSQSVWIFPGATNAAASVSNRFLPRLLRVVVTIGGATPSFTLSGIYFNGIEL